MKAIETKLQGVMILEPQAFEDERGFFMESYRYDRYASIGIPHIFVQDNHSMSVQAGTLRGLHYQLPPKAQTKLVRVVSGAIYDVAVDIRRDSPTFGQWVSVILSDDNRRQLLVPHGFAHGFCTLAPNTQVIYKVDEYYDAAADRGIRWNDAELGIPWPATKPILSAKDGLHPLLREAALAGLSWSDGVERFGDSDRARQGGRSNA